MTMLATPNKVLDPSEVAVLPLPEMLGRKDSSKDGGAWSIESCAPVRGLPYTDIVGKKMVVPVSQEETARAIRAHEMMHARVSPGSDFLEWLNRGIASENALRAVEEMRVNFLCNKAGFDVATHLSDGSELTAGEKVSENDDWTGAVYGAIATACSGGNKPFLTGVRRHNREWGDSLKAIIKKFEKELKKADKYGRLSDTAIDPKNNLSPIGFSTTERLAELLDRFANPPKKEENENEASSVDHKEKHESEDAEGPAAKTNKGKANKPAPISPDDVKKQNTVNNRRSGGVDSWVPLKFGESLLNRVAPGGLGKKRRPSAFGRNPRRLTNALTDPEKRVFDQWRKGNGGVVVIDGSGSMQLKTEDIVRIVEKSPGATVVVYSSSTTAGAPNIWILADKGKMVQSLPTLPGNNGVDGPALAFAISKRNRSSSPIVFITDGEIHGDGTGYSDLLAMDCINQCIKSRVIVRRNVTQGVEVLEQLNAGMKPRTEWPRPWQRTYFNATGSHLK